MARVPVCQKPLFLSEAPVFPKSWCPKTLLSDARALLVNAWPFPKRLPSRNDDSGGVAFTSCSLS
ncbi:hypothetical protein SAMN06265222_102411 [Neorhodopirellula lusitana]|uniref:Uncharacterized protein n=1 Tax=Neorhodopirellula lusitana TaxID=445327 RepID=A0ABY1PXC5_9BACT|nr:hypothetical protein SAMN06265222_102411 [Neorhodopirellula lusitana]